MISLSILFSGRGSNANSIINLIMKEKLNFKLKNIVCNNKDALGIKLIKKQNFDTKIVDIRSYKDKKQYNIDLERTLDPENNDLLVLCGYMHKLPNHIINSYHGNIINIHPSILPKYKGLDTQEKCHPHLTVELGDLAMAKEKLTLLQTDQEFYNDCSEIAIKSYQKHYKELIFKNKVYGSLDGL